MKPLYLTALFSMTVGLSVLTMAASPVYAQTSVKDQKPVNNTAPSSFKVIGAAQTNAIIKDNGVIGGEALRLTVTNSDAKPWTAGVLTFLKPKIKSGDKISATVWLRAEAGETGKPTKVTLFWQESEGARAELKKQTYTITPQWAAYTWDATAGSDYAGYATFASVHVAHAKQTVDVGPIHIVNAGQ